MNLSNLSYDLNEDLELTLFNQEHFKSIKQFKSDPENVFRVTFMKGANKVVVRAEKNSTFRMHWLFTLNGKSYNTMFSAQQSNIRAEIAELLNKNSEELPKFIEMLHQSATDLDLIVREINELLEEKPSERKK